MPCFLASGEMILQGQDIPIHLGSLMPALRTVADYFGDDIHPGDVFYHNDPAWSGSHIVDCCMYKPVFYQDELVFWTVSKGHVTDIGGPVPAGYNPEAKEIYAEGLRIPPLKIRDRGVERRDVVNFILTNVRSRRLQAGDMRAQLAAVTIGERNLIGLLEKYGKDVVMACMAELLDLAEHQMRAFISAIPDGTYHGKSVLEDAGHGYGDIEIAATVEIAGDDMAVSLSSPPQIPYFINSYAANSLSGVYLGVMMFAQLPPPYNEGLYRPITVDVGPEGTLTNAKEPAPHANCTTTPSESITDAVRMALEQALPEKAVASWGHSNGLNIAGQDYRSGEEYVSMILATIISGGGASHKTDGWPAVGPQCCFGALTSGDVEILEYQYPIIIHRYGLMTDSGGAGKLRGGSGTHWEVEPLRDPMTVVMFGEGRRYPAQGALGAVSKLCTSPRWDGHCITRKTAASRRSRPTGLPKSSRANVSPTRTPAAAAWATRVNATGTRYSKTCVTASCPSRRPGRSMGSKSRTTRRGICLTRSAPKRSSWPESNHVTARLPSRHRYRRNVYRLYSGLGR